MDLLEFAKWAVSAVIIPILGYIIKLLRKLDKVEEVSKEVKEIRSNDLPHLHKKIDEVDKKVSYIQGQVDVIKEFVLKNNKKKR